MRDAVAPRWKEDITTHKRIFQKQGRVMGGIGFSMSLRIRGLPKKRQHVVIMERGCHTQKMKKTLEHVRGNEGSIIKRLVFLGE